MIPTSATQMRRAAIRISLVAALFFSAVFDVPAQTDSLRRSIEGIIASKHATIGVAIAAIEGRESLSVNNDMHYPLQSVFKFHIALAVLDAVDKGKLALTQEIFVRKSDLLPDTWSPLRDAYPNGDVSLTLAKILEYTVAQSDNNGCDLLLRLVGGPAAVNDYIRAIGIKDVSIQSNEAEMHREWSVQFGNWTTPASAVELLRTFHGGNILSRTSYDFLWETMAATRTGGNRIKGRLPAGTVVAHKTGTSDTNEEGVTAAINDIGIVTLPNGRHFAIGVFVSNSKESNETNERIIADIAKLAWDYFVSLRD